MNKKAFIEELKNKTNYTKEQCNLINEVLDNTFLIGKKNKDKMIEQFIEKLNIDNDEANKVYETVMSIIGSNILDKIKHPFDK